MTSGGVTFAIALSRNLVGYLRNYFKTNYAESYDINKLHSTWYYYYGIIGTILTTIQVIELPSPYKELILAIATLVSIVLDFTLSEIKKLKS